MSTPTSSWDEDTLIVRVPLAAFAAAIEFLDGGGRRYRIADKEAFKAFIAAQALEASRFGRVRAGSDELLTEWIDTLVERAAEAPAGLRIEACDGGDIAVVPIRRAGRPIAAPEP